MADLTINSIPVSGNVQRFKVRIPGFSSVLGYLSKVFMGEVPNVDMAPHTLKDFAPLSGGSAVNVNWSKVYKYHPQRTMQQ